MNGQDREVCVHGSLRLNNSEAVRDAALAGLGLVQRGGFLVSEDIRQGRLTPVLADCRREEPPVSAVYPTRRHLSPKVLLALGGRAGHSAAIARALRLRDIIRTSTKPRLDAAAPANETAG